jgi:hypothetical protein
MSERKPQQTFCPRGKGIILTEEGAGHTSFASNVRLAIREFNDTGRHKSPRALEFIDNERSTA